MRWLIIGVTAVGLVGCSSAPSPAWMLYARAHYLYGRLEAVTESACATANPSDALLRACLAAGKARDEITTMVPVIERELAQAKPDWARIYQYVDLVLGFALKFVIP